MPVENFLRYKGSCYDVGTKLRFYYKDHGVLLGVKTGVIEKFINGHIIIKTDDGFICDSYSTIPNLYDFDKIIVEIIEPVYYKEEPKQIPTNNRNYPSEDSIFIGWILYVLIMLVGTIFKARLMIWIFATALFFLWKNGFMGKRD